MSTLTAEQGRAIADAAFENTRAVMARDAGLRQAAAAAEAEARALAAAGPEAAGELDTEMAAAETAPEVDPGTAAAAQARANAETLAWLQAGPDAELEAEAG